MGFFQVKNRIQVVSFSSCDKMTDCRELVACAEFAASDIETHILCVCMHMGSAYALLCYVEKWQTHDTPQTHDVMGV